MSRGVFFEFCRSLTVRLRKFDDCDRDRARPRPPTAAAVKDRFSGGFFFRILHSLPKYFKKTIFFFFFKALEKKSTLLARRKLKNFLKSFLKTVSGKKVLSFSTNHRKIKETTEKFKKENIDNLGVSHGRSAWINQETTRSTKMDGVSSGKLVLLMYCQFLFNCYFSHF